MLEDGSWEKPPRPKKRGEFVPIEEVSEEHLHPAYDAGPLTPEEFMIQAEENGMERPSEEVKEAAEQDDANDGEDGESREENERRLRAAIAKFIEQEGETPHEPAPRKKKIKSEGSVRGAHGKWGPEPKGKHKKGGETIRRPDGRLEA